MEGWQCPICKKVYAPFVTSCFQCGDGNIRTSTGADYIAPKAVAVIHPQEQIDRGMIKKKEDAKIIDPPFIACPYLKNETKGLACAHTKTCKGPCELVNKMNMEEDKECSKEENTSST